MEIAKSNTNCDPSLKFLTGIRKIEIGSERFGDVGDAWEDWIVVRRELVR